MGLDDTITAISTPIGIGGVSVIRLSGKDSITIARRIFSDSFSKAASHTVHYQTLVDPKTQEKIDSVVVTVFKEPSSYTGLDTIEISCHGGILNSKKILEILIEQGARLAEPGEFTKLAFLNGKIDLAQVEGIADLIHAKTEAARRSSAAQFMGNLSNEIKLLRSELISLCSLLEIDLDFAEENLLDVDRNSVVVKISTVEDRIEALLKTYNFGHVLREGARISIVGKPNVGKSSLLNVLLGRNRAIVSETPGTTRDFIEESIDINGIPFSIVDTAGIRHSKDDIENLGMGFSYELLNNSDLIIVLLDSSSSRDEQDRKVIELVKRVKAHVLFVANKADLKNQHDFLLENKPTYVSAKTGFGINELKDEIYAVFSSTASYDSPVISRLRHKVALEKSLESLSLAKKTIEQKYSFEFAAVDVKNAISHLGEIVGEITNDDVLNNIFANFCIGK